MKIWREIYNRYFILILMHQAFPCRNIIFQRLKHYRYLHHIEWWNCTHKSEGCDLQSQWRVDL